MPRATHLWIRLESSARDRTLTLNQDKGGHMHTFTALKLTREGAMMVLEAALREAQKVGRPVSVAVVDEGGHLFAFSRTADAELYSIQNRHCEGPRSRADPLPDRQEEPYRQ